MVLLLIRFCSILLLNSLLIHCSILSSSSYSSSSSSSSSSLSFSSFSSSSSPSSSPSSSAAESSLDRLFVLLPRQSTSSAYPAQSFSSSSQPEPTTLPSRANVSFLLFTIPLLILGILLLLLPARLLPRLPPSIAFAIATGFPTWALSINLLPIGGLTGPSSSLSQQYLALWALILGASLIGFTFGLLIGHHHRHRFGYQLLSIEAGFALGISVLIFSPQLTIRNVYARWIFLAIITSLFPIITILRPSITTPVACATSGTFLLFLAIDLLVTENRGMSLGIRFLFDHNPHHAQDLFEYNPPIFTRVFLAVSWLFMLLGTWYQYQVQPINQNWLLHAYRSHSSTTHSTMLGEQDPDKNALIQPYPPDLTAASVLSSENPSLLSPNMTDHVVPPPTDSVPHEFESPCTSDQRCTANSYDTGLSAIPELTEHSNSVTGGSRRASTNGQSSMGIVYQSHRYPSGSTYNTEHSNSLTGGSRRASSTSGQSSIGIVHHSHRYPSSSTYNSHRRQTLSSEYHTPSCPSSPNGPADPSAIPVSPPPTVLSATTVLPEDSISARQKPSLTFYSQSGLIEEETEVVMTQPIALTTSDRTDQPDHESNPHNMTRGNAQLNSSPRFAHPTTPDSTGVLSRLVRAFEEESVSTNPSNARLEPVGFNNEEQINEERALQFDAERWASLTDRQPPYVHTARLRRDLHSWTTEELP